MNRIIKKMFIGVVFLLGFLVIPANGAAVAKSSINGGTNIIAKAMLEGAWQCYQGGALNTSFLASKFTDSNNGFVIGTLGNEAVKFPYGLTDIGDNNLDCRQLFFKYNDGDQEKIILFSDMYKNTKDMTPKEKAQFFAGGNLDGNGGLGYTATPVTEQISETGQRMIFTIRTDKDMAEACGGGNPITPVFKDPNDGSIVDSIVFPTVTTDDSGKKLVVIEKEKQPYNVPIPGSKTTVVFDTNCGSRVKIADQSSANKIHYIVYWGDSNYNGAAVQGNVYATAKKKGYEFTESAGKKVNFNSNIETIKFEDFKLEDAEIDYEINRNTDTAKGASNFLKGINELNGSGYRLPTDVTSYSDLALTKQEVFDLYKYYLWEVYGLEVHCEGEEEYEGYETYSGEEDDYPLIAWGGCGQCRVKRESKKVKNVYGIVNLGDTHLIRKIDNANVVIDVLADLLDDMDEISTGTCDTGRYDPNNGSGGNNGNNGNNGSGGGSGSGGGLATLDTDIVDCNQFDNIGAMQWMLCPTMNNTQYTANWIDGMAEKYLTVNKDLYNSGTGTQLAWGMVRNVANVLMIIFFLIVILSQLTGRGIDNYGIKKMLPRLIMMALLVNLSFYICQLALDVSNIAGVGLRNMFGQMGNATAAEVSGPNFMTGMLVGFFSAAAGGGAAAVTGGITAANLGITFAGLSVAWVAVIIAAIILLLVIIVAILTLLLMLGAREVIIVFCVIISPLAFACFILPNTQHLFKKWWDLFKAAIVIFPLCGALSGISYLLRSMALSGTEYTVWGSAILMILPYIGFFWLPMLLNNALIALGKLGGALTSAGQKIRGGMQAVGAGAVRVAQNSEAYKQRQEEAARRRQEKYMQNVLNRVKKKEEAGIELSANDKLRAKKATLALNEFKTQRELANVGVHELTDAEAKARAVAAKDAQEIRAATDEYNQYTPADLKNELDRLVTGYDGSDDMTSKLRAAYGVAESKDMYEDIYNTMKNLRLSSKKPNEAKVLSDFARSKEAVLSQYGKKVAKMPVPASINDFAVSGALERALKEKGPTVLNSLSDDGWKYLNQMATEMESNIASGEMMLNAGATSDDKVAKQVAHMISNGFTDANEFSAINAKMLVAQNDQTTAALATKAMSSYGSDFYNNFLRAVNDIAKDPALVTNLRPEQKKWFNKVRGLSGYTYGAGI